MSEKKNKRKISRLILTLLEIILTIIIILVCTIIVVQRVSDNEKSVFGYRFFKIETGSMIPKYNINDVILVKEVDSNTIKTGDDLVYVGNSGELAGMIITHEVVDIKNDQGKNIFYTKGIQNNTIDPKISENQIIGVVQYKSYILTIITNILLNRVSLYFLVILPFTLYIFFKEIHSKDKRERKLEELKAKKEEKEANSMIKKKRGELIINSPSSRKDTDKFKTKRKKKS